MADQQESDHVSKPKIRLGFYAIIDEEENCAIVENAYESIGASLLDSGCPNPLDTADGDNNGSYFQIKMKALELEVYENRSAPYFRDILYTMARKVLSGFSDVDASQKKSN